jgi:hypothetical protein
MCNVTNLGIATTASLVSTVVVNTSLLIVAALACKDAAYSRLQETQTGPYRRTLLLAPHEQRACW